MVKIRFFIVGIINTIFGYSIFALGIFNDLKYELSLLMATILGSIFNYKTIKVLVFQSKKNTFIWFIVIYGIVYFINLIGIWIMKKILNNTYLAAIAVIPISTIISYKLNKLIMTVYE